MEPNKTDGNYLRSIYFKNYLGTGKDLKLRLHNDSPEPMHSARFITGPNGWDKTQILRFIKRILEERNPAELPRIADSGELKLTKGSIKWALPNYPYSMGYVKVEGVDIPKAQYVTYDETYDIEWLTDEEKAVFDEWVGIEDDLMVNVYKEHRHSLGHNRLGAIIHAAFISKECGRILLIDEPEAHQHLAVQKEFLRHINQLTDQSILCATHSTDVFDNDFSYSVDLFERLELTNKEDK